MGGTSAAQANSSHSHPCNGYRIRHANARPRQHGSGSVRRAAPASCARTPPATAVNEGVARGHRRSCPAARAARGIPSGLRSTRSPPRVTLARDDVDLQVGNRQLVLDDGHSSGALSRKKRRGVARLGELELQCREITRREITSIACASGAQRRRSARALDNLLPLSECSSRGIASDHLIASPASRAYAQYYAHPLLSLGLDGLFLIVRRASTSSAAATR